MGDAGGRTVRATPIGDALYVGSVVGASLALVYGPWPALVATCLGFAVAFGIHPRTVDGLALKLTGLLLPQALALALVSAQTLYPLGFVGRWTLDTRYAFVCATGAFASVIALLALGVLARQPEKAASVSRFAIRLLPAACAASVVLCVNAWSKELRRFPPPEDYVASLPVVDEVPPADTLECEVDLGAEMRAPHPEWPKSACITKEVSVDGLLFHYHCTERRGMCDAFVRYAEGRTESRVRAASGSNGIRLHRDPDVDGFVVESRPIPIRVGRDGWVYGVDRFMTRVAPPFSWTVMATIGSVVGLLALVAERSTRSSRNRSSKPSSFFVLALTALIVLGTPSLVWAIRVLTASTP